MGSRITTGLVAASLVAVVVGGCGGGAASGPAVTWTNDVCGALAGFTRAASTQPKIDGADPVAAVRDLGAYLRSTAAALQETIKGIDTAGPAPVAGGDEYVGRLKTTLGSIRTSFEDAGSRLAKVDTSSPEKLAAAIPAVVAPLQSLGTLADPTQGLESNTELRTAAEQAPNCKQLRSS